ncbi:MAG: poly-gamma-glutamate biosynthesis protein PgsC [Deltaproteobacteria bacterium]|nr:poly-gamma-glutamate biosynthesis protein PgsC [Deltaproteobacteria bacterium]
MELLSVAIGVGLVVSLLLSELFGIAAGGMVVPGYIALHLRNPLNVAVTLAVALATYGVIHALSNIVVIYGRRRTALTILIGFLIGTVAQWAIGPAQAIGPEFMVIGFVIPGLIAIWLERQGVVETIASLLTAAVAVRLVLVLSLGEELLK